MITYMNNYYEYIFIFLLMSLWNAENLTQTDNWDNLATKNNNFLILYSLNIVWSDIDSAVNGAQRNSIHFILYLNQHSLNNSQGQRQLNLEYRTFINLSSYVYMTA